MSMKIEPKPVAPLPATSEEVVMVMAVDYASARHIREARVGGEWHVRGWSCRPREASSTRAGQPEHCAARKCGWRAAHPP